MVQHLYFSFIIAVFFLQKIKADVGMEIKLKKFTNPGNAIKYTPGKGFIFSSPGTYTCCDGSVIHTNQGMCSVSCDYQFLLCLSSRLDQHCSSNTVAFRMHDTTGDVLFGNAIGNVSQPFRLVMPGAWTVNSRLIMKVTQVGTGIERLNDSWESFLDPVSMVSSYSSIYSPSDGTLGNSLKQHQAFVTFKYTLFCTNCTGGRGCQDKLHLNDHMICQGDIQICESGWEKSLTFCRNINECITANPCQHRGVCRDTPGSYTCSCQTGWQGKNCEQNSDHCISRPCNQNGQCQNVNGDFTCTCSPGWTGKTCDVDMDECQNDICKNGGTCSNTPGGFMCYCLPGWSGNECETDVNECQNTTCQHGGICLNTPGSYVCNCSSGWGGPNCQTDYNECELSNPCQNGGTCLNNKGSFTCECSQGFTGHLCEQDINECTSTPCENGGHCINLNGKFQCNCVRGWTGETCDEDFDECQQLPCKHGGTCHNTIGSFSCQCPDGWSERNCTEDIDECASVPCKNGGTCYNTNGSFSCQCSDGWDGVNCTTDIDECQSSPCNYGNCININGTYKCNCQSGWTGEDCDHDINECYSDPCLNDGTCSNNNGAYECNCSTGWRGQTCEQDIDECVLGLCQNDASCLNLNGSFSCLCREGFTGRMCDLILETPSSTLEIETSTFNGPSSHIPPKSASSTIRTSRSISTKQNVEKSSLQTVRSSVKRSTTKPPFEKSTPAVTRLPKAVVTTAEQFTRARHPLPSDETSRKQSIHNQDIVSLEFHGTIESKNHQKLRNFISSFLCATGKIDTQIRNVTYTKRCVPNSQDCDDISIETFTATCDGKTITQPNIDTAIRNAKVSALRNVLSNLVIKGHGSPEAEAVSSKNWFAEHQVIVISGAVGLAVILGFIFIAFRLKMRRAQKHSGSGYSTNGDRDAITFENNLYGKTDA